MFNRSIIITVLAAVPCFDTYSSNNRQSYTNEELVNARLRWVEKERDIEWLKQGAGKHAPTSDLNCHDSSGQYAIVNASQQLITTFLPDGQTIALSYEEFDVFILDEDLYNQAKSLYDTAQALIKAEAEKKALAQPSLWLSFKRYVQRIFNRQDQEVV